MQKSSVWLRVILCGGIICAGMFLLTGLQPGVGVVRYQREVESSSYFFYLEIVNRTFNNSLLDTTSVYYNNLKTEVEALMDSVYNCSSCYTVDVYDGAFDMSFRNGSLVIAKMTLVFHTQLINQFVVKYLFINSIKANPPENLKVNLEYTRDVQTPVVATTTPAPPTPPMVISTSLTDSTNATTISPITSRGAVSQVANDTVLPIAKSTIAGSTSVTTKDPNSSSWTTAVPAPSTSSVTPQSNGTTGWASTFPHTNATGVTSSHPLTKTSGVPSPTATSHPMTGSSDSGNQRPYWFDWVPGWAIALLVLAALILLLLIILFILLVVRWFCKKEEKQLLPVSDPYQWTPSPMPAYMSHSPAPVLKDMADDHPDKPKRNKSGLYVVNP